ncbi:MAG: uridine kinase [Bacteroidetes bacterium]|nr:MAG: uridine kinase [Bacteroidota bacterium]
MNNKPLILGIAGGSGSGKTTVTEKIVSQFEPDAVAVLKHDYYYKDIASFDGMRADEINFDHPNALETTLLVSQLEALKSWKTIELPIYDFTTYKRLPRHTVIQPKPIIIVEGILIFVEKSLRDLMDVKIYVDTDADERLLRRLRRDIIQRGRSIESVMHQYGKTVKPMHLEFVEPSKHWADIIIPRGGENSVAIDMVCSKIKEMLRNARSSPF